MVFAISTFTVALLLKKDPYGATSAPPWCKRLGQINTAKYVRRQNCSRKPQGKAVANEQRNGNPKYTIKTRSNAFQLEQPTRKLLRTKEEVRGKTSSLKRDKMSRSVKERGERSVSRDSCNGGICLPRPFEQHDFTRHRQELLLSGKSEDSTGSVPAE